MKKPTLLYVDDEPINLTLFELNFNKEFNVISANSGQEALKIATENPEICVVVSDLKMPKMDGLSFIREFKSSNQKEIPCFLLTGFHKTPEISSALKEKVILQSFTKPMDKDQISEVICQYIVCN